MEHIADFSAVPDSSGNLADFTIRWPDYEEMLVFSHGHWPRGSHLGNVKLVVPGEEGGVRPSFSALLRLADGSFLAFVPCAGEYAYAWLVSQADRIVLRIGHHGMVAVENVIQPLYAYAVSEDPYAAMMLAWKKISESSIILGNPKLRGDKDVFGELKTLGYMSWGEYAQSIDETKLVSTIKTLSDSPVPVRWALIDAGHYDRSSALAHKQKFPNGYTGLVLALDTESADKMQSFILWYSFCIGDRMMQYPGNLPEEMQEHVRDVNGIVLPHETAEATEAWWDHVLSIVDQGGASGVKIDFHGFELVASTGGGPYVGKERVRPEIPENKGNAIGNPYRLSLLMNRALDRVASRKDLSIFQCNWIYAPALFNFSHSLVGRVTGDYHPPAKAVKHEGKVKGATRMGYYAPVYVGALVWPDHDEFDHADIYAGRIDCIRHSMSGGGAPLYYSKKMVQNEQVMSMCYQDGELLRPLAPGSVTRDGIFQVNPSMIKAMAPLNNNTAVFHIVNIDNEGVKDGRTLSTELRPEHYRQATGLMQPYPGLWTVPEEGLFVYDAFLQKGELLEKAYTVTIDGFSDRLVQISPVRDGWSVIGRSDKYLSAASYELVSSSMETITIKLRESGPIALYSALGEPYAEGVRFTSSGNDLYLGEMEPGLRDISVRIDRRQDPGIEHK
jgi:hypothetical protein